MSIVVTGLQKRFAERWAVRGVSFEVAPGEVYGLIGPNGAGKTTTMRMIVGLMLPHAGSTTICGLDVHRSPLKARSKLGFISGTTGLYQRLSGRELLTFYGRLYGCAPEAIQQRIAALETELGLSGILEQRCGTLSTGQRQRISLARASIHDPEVMILDEPTAGLDVLASRFVADFVRRVRDRGRSVLFSTHYMTEAELLCDRIGLLDRGRLVAEGDPAVVKGRFGCDSLEEVFIQLYQTSNHGDPANGRVGAEA